MRRKTAILFLLLLCAAIPAVAQPRNGVHKVKDSHGRVIEKGKYKKGLKTGKWTRLTVAPGGTESVEVWHYRDGKLQGEYRKYGDKRRLMAIGQYAQDQKTGEWKLFYGDEKKLQGIEYYKNGKPDSLWTTWWPGGNVRSEKHYSNGLAEGLEREWHQGGGFVKKEVHWKNGKRDGEMKVFDAEGRPEIIAQFENGLLEGPRRKWKDGIAREEQYFSKGRLHGVSTFWSLNGDTLSRVTYREGYAHGPATYWKNGRRESEVMYRDRKKHGKTQRYDFYGEYIAAEEWYTEDRLDSVTSFYPNGQRMHSEVFNEKGKPDGPYFEWSENGKLLVNGKMQNGKRQGEWKVFYPDGALKSKMMYTDGQLVQQYARFYPNGKKLLEQTYTDSKPGGVTRIWDEKGKLLRPEDPVYEALLASSLPDETFVEPRRLFAQEETDSEDVLVDPEVPAEFAGGEQSLREYIDENTFYPEGASVQGMIIVSFTVEADGSVSNVKVVKGIAGGEALEAEAVRVVESMPRWTPAQIDGRAIRTQYNLPVRFKKS